MKKLYREGRVVDVLERLHLAESDGFPTLFGFVLLVGVGLVALSAVIMAIAIPWSRVYGHGVCNRWSEQTGIETKWAVLGLFDTGTCLARTPDGRWVVNSKWQAFVKGDK